MQTPLPTPGTRTPRRTLALLPFALTLASCPATSTPRDADTDAPIAAQDAAPDAASTCPDSVAQSLTGLSLDVRYWDGESAPAPLTLPAVPASCGALTATQPWALLNTAGSAPTVAVRLEDLPTGLHTAHIELRSPQGTSVASVPVRVRVFRTPPPGSARRVLVIGIDGTRPDALQAADTPALDYLVRRAAHTFAASTHLDGPTVSAPGWMSVFTGVTPGKHRVVANEHYEERDARYRTFVARAHDAGRRAVVATSWTEVTDFIVEPGTTAAQMFSVDALSTQWLVQRMLDTDADVYFEHLNIVDAAGHASGFATTNASYVRAIATSDLRIGQMIDGVLARPNVAREDWLFVLTTDHGGEGQNHGAMNAANQTIWLVVAGPSVRPSPLPATQTTHMDVAPTVLRWIGIPIDPAWGLDGVPRGIE